MPHVTIPIISKSWLVDAVIRCVVHGGEATNNNTFNCESEVLILLTVNQRY